MVFVRKLVLVCLENNISFKAKHIPGTHNKLADSLISLAGSNFQATGTSEHESISDRHPPALAASNLANIITHLTTSSLQPSSIPTYTLELEHSLLNSTAQCFRTHALACL